MSLATRWVARRRPADAADRRRRAIALEVDPLERRQVLSHALPHATGQALIAAMRHGAGVTAQARRIPFQAIGLVVKAPQFAADYVGPLRPDLNLVSGSAKVVSGRGLVLTGTVVGQINKRPRDASQSDFFVFGINRGSASAVAPFNGRPGIRFDAVIVISIQPQGISGTILDLTAPPGSTPVTIAPRDIHVSGRTVTVDVNPDHLPTPFGGNSLLQSAFNLWTRSSLSNPPQGSNVASFLPEDGLAPIVAPQGLFPSNNFAGSTIGPVPPTPTPLPGPAFRPPQSSFNIPTAAPTFALPTNFGPFIGVTLPTGGGSTGGGSTGGGGTGGGSGGGGGGSNPPG